MSPFGCGSLWRQSEQGESRRIAETERGAVAGAALAGGFAPHHLAGEAPTNLSQRYIRLLLGARLDTHFPKPIPPPHAIRGRTKRCQEVAGSIKRRADRSENLNHTRGEVFLVVGPPLPLKCLHLTPLNPPPAGDGQPGHKNTIATPVRLS